MEAIFYQIFEALPRQGPGDTACTRRAFFALNDLPAAPRILDVGCGVGMQAMDLAVLTVGRIVALDNHRPFLATLKQNARQAGHVAAIHPVQGDMATLPFATGSFDLIWSEGAAYFLGFENALRQWRDLLRPDGFLAVSHVAWLLDDQPSALQAYWNEKFPDISTDAVNQTAIVATGYELIDHFVLPPESWWRHYYSPMQQVLVTVRNQYAGNEEAEAIFEAFDKEINMHRRYSDYYGYIFYVMRR